MISNWRVKTTCAQQYCQPLIFYCHLYWSLLRTKGTKILPLFLSPITYTIFSDWKYFIGFLCNIIGSAIILGNATILYYNNILFTQLSIGIFITVKITFYTLNIMDHLCFVLQRLSFPFNKNTHCFLYLSGVFITLKTIATIYYIYFKLTVVHYKIQGFRIFLKKIIILHVTKRNGTSKWLL